MDNKSTTNLMRFIDKSPSCYHVISNIINKLDGFIELSEGEKWNIKPGKSYYVMRNMSSIIAFKVPKNYVCGFHIVASHSDSPTFKLKPNAEIEISKEYVKLNIEKYGGMICNTWFDKPLSIAGRITVKDEEKIITKLVNIDRDLVLIPSLAIHMGGNPEKPNVQTDMLPLYGGSGEKASENTLLKIIAENAKVDENSILGSDLFLYNRMKSSIWGQNNEFVSAPRLDDLQCVFASLEGFLKSDNNKNENISVLSVFDNEEVGSGTKQGAKSTFLKDTLIRINDAMGRTSSEYLQALASSFMLSADNAHAVHPNMTDKSDVKNRPHMNKGVVIKYNANQKYTTDSVSEAIFKSICDRASVPWQTYANRSDMPGGSTLGNLAMENVSINTVDIGLSQLAMHSSYETAGVLDTEYMQKAILTFYNTSVVLSNTNEYTMKHHI
ncbi:MAG: M18 family aminopeptidase [Oscillospiraceae bacterium]